MMSLMMSLGAKVDVKKKNFKQHIILISHLKFSIRTTLHKNMTYYQYGYVPKPQKYQNSRSRHKNATSALAAAPH